MLDIYDHFTVYNGKNIDNNLPVTIKIMKNPSI
jgi:hypothetical protein